MAAQVLSLQGTVATEAGKHLCQEDWEVIMAVGIRSLLRPFSALRLYLSVGRDLSWGLGALVSCSVMWRSCYSLGLIVFIS